MGGGEKKKTKFARKTYVEAIVELKTTGLHPTPNSPPLVEQFLENGESTVIFKLH